MAARGGLGVLDEFERVAQGRPTCAPAALGASLQRVQQDRNRVPPAYRVAKLALVAREAVGVDALDDLHARMVEGLNGLVDLAVARIVRSVVEALAPVAKVRRDHEEVLVRLG